MREISFTCENCGISASSTIDEFKINIDESKKKTNQLDYESLCTEEFEVLASIRKRVKKHNDNIHIWQKEQEICDYSDRIEVLKGRNVVDVYVKKTIPFYNSKYHYIECPICNQRYYF